ncbi:hypothetical protein AUJ46_01925 [Candidatus Peregrinibacteria bacterium CG1_02_54_53]|nr:MAG: hypothetical protein AUJ46_01925 [Candidatus Peregrinibacteria bacterium CG1_02_54_53]
MRSIPVLLATIKEATQELEAALQSKGSHSISQKAHQKIETDYSGPSGGIKMLVNSGFFKKPRSLGEVIQELKKETYNYRKEVISNALIRLARQRVLVRVSSEKDSREKWNYAERK